MTTIRRGGFGMLPHIADQPTRAALRRLEERIAQQAGLIDTLTARLTASEATSVTLRNQIVRTEKRVSAGLSVPVAVSAAARAAAAAAAAPIPAPWIPELFADWSVFALAHGSWATAQTGDLTACAQICVDFAASLNPTGDPASWGALSKTSGQNGALTTVGYVGIDVIIFSNRYDGVAAPAASGIVDLIIDAGSLNPQPGWGASVAKLATNNWVSPV